MNSIKFTEIPDRLKYNLNIRGKLSTIHSEIVAYMTTHYNGTHRQKQQVINVMNTLSYIVVSNDTLPDSWNAKTPLDNITLVDDDLCQRVLGNMYISAKYVIWDLELVDTDVEVTTNISTEKPNTIVDAPAKPVDVSITTTPKEDLYLQSPLISRFDYQHPYASKLINGITYSIYPSLPVIPTKQNEISITTDVTKMTSRDLLNLFPNTLIHTRFASLYNTYPNMEYDDQLGTILPIEGYSLEQLKDNIIRYPHIYKLSKVIDDRIVPFYSKIEIDNELFDVASIWWQLPESSIIPYSIDLVKEYVVRRYLLERDIKGIEHKYPIFGGLESFITLFATIEDYASWGYTDAEQLAKNCVTARVNYKRLRNPVLRSINNA